MLLTNIQLLPSAIVFDRTSWRDNPAAKGTSDLQHLQFTVDGTIEAAIETAKAEIDMYVV